MNRPLIDLTRFFVMLSDALELASPGMAMHQTKAAFIALRIAERLGLSRPRVRDLIYAALLHDIGALSPEEKVELHSPNPRLVKRHCRNGAIVLSRVHVLERAALLVGLHHEPWRLRSSDDSLAAFDANIIHLADFVEVAIDRSGYILFQDEEIRRSVAASRGDEFAEELVDAFLEVSKAEEFWLELASPALPDDLANDRSAVEYRCSLTEFASVSTLVRDIIDFRSTFTATHSSGVAAAAGVIGRMLGFSNQGVLMLEIAGNLHDIGKMAIPNSILLKPAPLDRRESAIMRQHPYHTGAVLGRAGLPQEVVEMASWHHERLDGSGYPSRAGASSISLGCRVLSCVDVFTALAEERPYRNSLDGDSIRHILEGAVTEGSLEPSVVGLLNDRYEEVSAAMREAQISAENYYRENFCEVPEVS